MNRPLTSGLAVFHRCLCAVLLSGMLSNTGDATATEFTTVEAGYQGRAQVGAWMPIRVTASDLPQGRAVALRVTTPDPRGNEVAEICGTTTAGTDSQIALQGLARTGRLDGMMRVELIDAETSESWCSTTIRCSEQPSENSGQPVQQVLQLYRHDVRFLLTTGQPAGIEELLNRAADASPAAPAVVGISIESVDDLPVDSRAYDMVSSIIFTGGVSLSDRQSDAVRSWVHAGGQLIITCADGIAELLGTGFGQWLDEHFELSPETRVVTDADLGAIQQMVPQATRISTFRRRVNMAQVGSDQPLALAQSTSGPLVARTGSGGGQLTFVSVNLDTRPLSQWKSLSEFYAVLLLGAPLNRSAGRGGSSRISSSGIGDLTTQLMATADPQPASGRWRAWGVIALGFCWLILIGPVDYLIVVVLLKRPRLTWITFPLWGIVAVAGLYTLKSGASETVLNAVHVMDVVDDGDTQSIQAMSLLSVSTPQTSRATLTAIPNTLFSGPQPRTELSWSGRPDDVYDGMYRETGIGGGSQSYTRDVSRPATLTSVPLLIDGSFETQARWWVEPQSSVLDSQLNVSGFGLLEGSFTHHLQAPLRDWVVVFGNRIYRPRDDARQSLPPGQAWEFLPGGSQITDLKSYLTGVRPAREAPQKGAPGLSTTSQPYSSGGRDPLDIVTMMSLYEVAGGESYTGLNHHALRRLDLSDSIRLNYAVVIGWMEPPVTRLKIDGSQVAETASSTIVRLLLPVNRQPASPAAMTTDDLKATEQNQQQPEETVPAGSSAGDDEASTNQEPSSD